MESAINKGHTTMKTSDLIKIFQVSYVSYLSLRLDTHEDF
jgi:hypothetical protein